ncbi:MAG: hypothetical protein NTV02_00615 [Candidatus Zambryskibacteria bacterium]|nr:hypothetical protein [Candidatus Zambryskibacteria bacterium]
MKKNIVQDVVFPKRSIRDVELPSRRKETAPIYAPQKTVKSSPRPVAISRKEEPEVEEVEDVEKEVKSEPFFPRERVRETPRGSYAFDYNTDIPPHKESRIGLWISLALFVIALGFGVSALFVSAKVTITPRTETIPVNASLSALKDRPSGEFGYQIVSVSGSMDKSVPAGSSQKVEKKASGILVVYNKTSTAPQKLIANTRFESADGKVFRISAPVTIPGQKTENGKVVPGSVEVSVIADQPGVAYNIGLSDFTVPGLKGDPRFTTIYARSKSPMSGGFSGDMKVVDTALEETTKKELESNLKAKLKNDIISQIPVNFILFDTALTYDIKNITQKDSEDSQAVLELSGSAHALIFDKIELSKALIEASKSNLDTAGQPLSVVNIADLTFVLTGNNQISQQSTGPVTFTLTGDAQVEWLFDESMLKNDLLGIKKADLVSILQAKYPSIQSAQVKILPLWKQSFPVDPLKVTIIKASPIK